MPRTTTHKIIAEIETAFQLLGAPIDEHEVAYPTLEITYTYYPGAPAYTPRGEYAPTDPPEPANIEFISARLIDGDGLAPEQHQIDEWAETWIQDDGYDRAIDIANDDLNPPDRD